MNILWNQTSEISFTTGEDDDTCDNHNRKDFHRNSTFSIIRRSRK